MIAKIVTLCAIVPISLIALSHSDPQTPQTQHHKAHMSQSVEQLCVNHHPAKRRTDVTYGGLPWKRGTQRDHLMPLELGGLDTADNVMYQRCDRTGPYGRCEKGPAKLKDDDEHLAGRQMCNGKWSLNYARQWLTERWPTDVAHGYRLWFVTH